MRERIDLAFHIMDREYGVTRLLDPEGELVMIIFICLQLSNDSCDKNLRCCSKYFDNTENRVLSQVADWRGVWGGSPPKKI